MEHVTFTRRLFAVLKYYGIDWHSYHIDPMGTVWSLLSDIRLVSDLSLDFSWLQSKYSRIESIDIHASISISWRYRPQDIVWNLSRFISTVCSPCTFLVCGWNIWRFIVIIFLLIFSIPYLAWTFASSNSAKWSIRFGFGLFALNKIANCIWRLAIWGGGYSPDQVLFFNGVSYFDSATCLTGAISDVICCTIVYRSSRKLTKDYRRTPLTSVLTSFKHSSLARMTIVMILKIVNGLFFVTHPCKILGIFNCFRWCFPDSVPLWISTWRDHDRRLSTILSRLLFNSRLT